jgi:hypothetical protein
LSDVEDERQAIESGKEDRSLVVWVVRMMMRGQRVPMRMHERITRHSVHPDCQRISSSLARGQGERTFAASADPCGLDPYKASAVVVIADVARSSTLRPGVDRTLQLGLEGLARPPARCMRSRACTDSHHYRETEISIQWVRAIWN